MSTTQDANDLLLSGGAPSAKFPTVGTLVKGTIEATAVTQQTDINQNPLTWPNGDPKMQVVITLATDERDPSIDDDDGSRRLFVKGQLTQAVRDALKKANAKLEVGGTLAVKFDHEAPPSKPGFNPQKVYVAQYAPPAQGAANDLLGGAPSQPAANDLI